jgi:uncharacterized protein
VSIEEQNSLIAGIARSHPGRLISFCAVDPRRRNSLDILKKAVEEWGMKGVKLHPCAGFYPDDRSFYPFYEWINDHKLPVLIHSGVILPPLKSKYARPIHFDDVLVDFPDINIIAAHLGTGWWEELAFMATRRANLYMEISGWQQTAWLYPDSFLKVLKRIIEIAGPEALLFGSDSPAYRSLPIIQNKEWVQILKNLSESPQTGFTREEVEAILGGNAHLLLGLT